jgi:outer membrane protein assembly factor BamB
VALSLGPVLDLLNTATGTSQQLASLGPNAAGAPAIGADGSLYVSYYPFGAPAPVISRLTPGGAVVWTSKPLPAGSLGPTTLGPNDLVLAAASTNAPDGGVTAAVFALDPATGSPVWNTLVPGNPGSDLVQLSVGPDGSVAVLVPVDAPSNPLTILTAGGAIRSTTNVQGNNIQAVARDGTVVILEGTAPGGNLAALRDGNVQWTATGSWGGLDETGTVLLSTADAIEGLDVSTGAQRWKLDPPKSLGQVSSTFYLAQGEIATVCGGGVFGASD